MRTDNMKNIIIALLLASAMNIPCYAGSLTATGELLIENLVPGKEYHIKDIAGMAFKITNNTDKPMHITVAPVLPDKQLLRKGFKCLPKIGWISVEPKTIVLEPGKTEYPDVVIKLPRNGKLQGKKFQFHVWSRTVPAAGGGIKVTSGIESVFLVTVAK